MKLLVCGSRSWTDISFILKVLGEYDPQTTEVIHGGARGADSLSGEAAIKLGMHVTVFPADWARYGKSAGFIRNDQMLAQKPDRVLAFWDGASRGTKHTTDRAKELGIPITIYT